MGEIPGIHLKNIPTELYEIILDKQSDIRKKKKKIINQSQIVIMLLKEAYCKT